MSIVYTLPGGEIMRSGQAFKLDGISYPRNWLQLATPQDLAERGIVAAEESLPPDPPPTAGQLLERLAQMRWQAENAGTMWGDITLPTDRERRSALKDAADKVRDGTLTAPIAVAFSNSVYAHVTLEQLDGAVNLITQHVQKVFSDALAVAAQIMGGTLTTYEQVDAAWEAARA